MLTVVERSSNFALQPLDLRQPLDIEREDSEKKKEDKEINLPTFIVARAEPTDEQSPSNVEARVLGELALEDEVAKSELGPRVSLSGVKVSSLN